MLIDAHTHLEHYDTITLPIALDEITARQILTVSVATDPESYAYICELSKSNRLILPCFGIHPWKAYRYAEGLETLQPLIDQSPMIGEIGLDYLWDEDPAHYPAQRIVFAHMLKAAAAQGKIVNLHTKAAEYDVISMLKQSGVQRSIIHWYSGPLDAYQILIEHGCYFTFGVETLHSASIQQLAKMAPLDRILTETDGPGGLHWLTGEVGMPHHIQDVLQILAELRHTTLAEMAALIEANWQRLNDFRLQI